MRLLVSDAVFSITANGRLYGNCLTRILLITQNFKIMIQFIKKGIKAFVIQLVRRSAYYKELNKGYHELWMHTQLNNPEWRQYSKCSLYDNCVETLKKHPQHYA